jgi:hypothetical protein
MSRSALGGSKGVHVNEQTFRLFRGDCKISFGRGVGKAVDFVIRLVDEFGLLGLEIVILDRAILRAYTYDKLTKYLTHKSYD